MKTTVDELAALVGGQVVGGDGSTPITGVASLAEAAAIHPVEMIVATTHGAAATLVDDRGLATRSDHVGSMSQTRQIKLFEIHIATPGASRHG